MIKRSRKVVDASPTWAPFAGWSVLLEHTSMGIGCEGIDGQVAERFARCSASLAETLADRFAALPPHSMHITLCDGINVSTAGVTAPENLHRVPEQLRSSINGLVDAASRPISWSLDGIEIRGHAVVVSLSTATDLTSILEARRRLQAAIVQVTNSRLGDDFRPHMTLGYLVDNADMAPSRQRVERAWRETAASEPLCVDTHGAHVYTFDDMATWHRQ